ncbi:flagellar hook-basal body protein [Caproiciproducens galactitolivorans]|uniref:Flagellar basal-body rod protein FlgG n=1 Tax=Caproiciproducens galactitolivorans TaxID=642589 RepID=A0A4Z0Y1V0_9FIRM|nr:flagellar hook-basal body protein [Caproiciproducens galactitolivorans]QEY34325.1 flagellar hook-basal body protein [Caproiciproducens galactitolivorans]TGJ77909.1 flagellar basal-body rod protein FlgG [Caproiciproducens galactitolivorans]
MDRGFYSLASGMLTQSRVLTGISNNLANIETPGYKKKLVTTSTFGNLMINRLDTQRTELGSVSLITVADKTNTIHTEGVLKNTNRALDFAIKGDGFFAVQGTNGTVYTRNGSFNVDSEGYLTLNNVGRVLGANGPIRVGTDQIEADEQGNLFANGRNVGRIAVYNFADYTALQAAGEGMFSYTGGAPALMQNPSILWKTVEGSNVNAAEEMTRAISAQRNLQNCSQALKMYDQVLTNSVTNIAKI